MNDEYILYLDMDGVLAGFEGGFKRLMNGVSFKDIEDKVGNEAAVKQYLTRGVEFWANLPWEHGGEEVWKASKDLFKRVNILSSSGTKDKPQFEAMVVTGKRLWLKRNIPEMSQKNVFIVRDKHEKQLYAQRNSILVDDMSSTIAQWNNQGGYGILHHSPHYKKTVETLEDIARPLKISEIAKRIGK